ncbi:MAG TPA: hypothetical protein EYQ24_01615 [Bacteroidetes bacterium]|nr:hypothetical protein [Bacteroidota bacterium]
MTGRVRQIPREAWGQELQALAPERPLSWLSVRSDAASGLATVLPWEPAVSLGYDPDADCIEVSTPSGVHRIADPLALFSLSSGAGRHRVLVLRFDGGVDVIDASPPGLHPDTP